MSDLHQHGLREPFPRRQCPLCTPCVLPILGQKWYKLQLHKPRYREVKPALCSGTNFSEAGEFWKRPLAPPALGAPRSHAPRPRFTRVYLLGPEKGEKPASPAAGPRPLLGGRGRAGRPDGGGGPDDRPHESPLTAGAGRDPETGRDRPGIRTVPGRPAARPSGPGPTPAPAGLPPPARPAPTLAPAPGRRPQRGLTSTRSRRRGGGGAAARSLRLLSGGAGDGGGSSRFPFSFLQQQTGSASRGGGVPRPLPPGLTPRMRPARPSLPEGSRRLGRAAAAEGCFRPSPAPGGLTAAPGNAM